MPCLVARRDPEPPLSPPRLLPCSLLSLALLAACGGGGASGGSVAAPASVPPVTGSTRPVTQSDLEIAELAYTDATRVPVGFRIEPARYTGNYATLAHLRSTDLDPATARPYEVCTNDFATALAWSESVATARPVYGDLVENNATPLYHEFVRRLRTTPARDAIDRVYRCDYVDRSDVDLRLASGSAGRLTRAGWTAAEVQQFGEYLWGFTADNNAGRVVLKSEVRADATAAVHSLHLARLARATAAGACDRLDVVRIDLRADRASGALTRTESALWSFGARREAGVTALCTT